MPFIFFIQALKQATNLQGYWKEVHEISTRITDDVQRSSTSDTAIFHGRPVGWIKASQPIWFPKLVAMATSLELSKKITDP